MEEYLVIHKDLLQLKPSYFLTLLALACNMNQDNEIKLKPSELVEIFGRELTLNHPSHMISKLKRIVYKGQPLIKEFSRGHFQIMTDDISVKEL